MAALFHDIERLASEADGRIEHLVSNYQTFKDAHARFGAAMTCAMLSGAGVDNETMDRINDLVETHERPRGDDELALLNDADARSFFSLNSSEFMDYYGREHTRRKVSYTYHCLRRETQARLLQIRYRSDVEGMILDELAVAALRSPNTAPLVQPLSYTPSSS